MRPTVHLLATGGTIASTHGKDGVRPTLNINDLLAAIPSIEETAEFAVEQVAQQPSPEMKFEALDRLRECVRAAEADGADGVVILHGTDTIEESAYYLDLTSEPRIPVVFTGAQRRFDERSSDAEANVADAVAAATCEKIGSGVFLAFNEELHAARDVTKGHTSKLEAFESPDGGPIAVKTRCGFEWNHPPEGRTLTIPIESVTATVEIVMSGLGVDGTQVERALAADVDGLVLEGTGLGNTTAGLADAVGRAIEAGVPVVVTSRCHAGSVAPVYGSAGGGRTLVELGVTLAGDLPAQKARIALLVTLSAGEPVTTTFEEALR